MVRALASHRCGPTSIPRFGVLYGLTLLVLFAAPRGFFPGTPAFPSPRNPTFDLICVNCYFSFTVSPISAPVLERLDTTKFLSFPFFSFPFFSFPFLSFPFLSFPFLVFTLANNNFCFDYLKYPGADPGKVKWVNFHPHPPPPRPFF